MTHKPRCYKVRVRFSTLDENEGGPGRLTLSFSLSLSEEPNLGLKGPFQFAISEQNPFFSHAVT